MQRSSHSPLSPSVASFYDPLQSPSHQSSIWAPRPTLSFDTSWSKNREPFGRPFRDRDSSQLRPDAYQRHRRTSDEDVFGPIGFLGSGRKNDVGAIGDGRIRSSPDLNDRHVAQIFRFLNLNSPGPYSKPPPLSVNLDASPDLSPISVTSALMTPTDLSPATQFDKLPSHYDYSHQQTQPHSQSLLFETGSPYRGSVPLSPSQSSWYSELPSYRNGLFNSPQFEPFQERHAPTNYIPQANRERPEFSYTSSPPWAAREVPSSDWLRSDDRVEEPVSANFAINDFQPQQSFQPNARTHEPINFLSLLHPSSSPPYKTFVSRIIKSSDQQASIFLQQKLKVANADERLKIVDAICERGYEMMAHRFGNWAVQRCLEAGASAEERKKVVTCMRGRVVELATNCYGCHVLQKALDCEEEVRLLIVSELLVGDPAQTLVNKHASHVWSKVMELTWTSPAPPIFEYVNKSLKGKWASLSCHETGSLVVQHAFENLEEEAKDGIIDELLNRGSANFAEVAKNQWGSYCIQHILEHGSAAHQQMTLDHLLAGLLEFAAHEQGSKSITKALKEGGKPALGKVIRRMCELSKSGRRAIIVDLALSPAGSQLIASVLPNADKDQRALLYESIRGHIVTLRGCKTGSKVIWLFDRMRAYYGY